MKRLKLEIMTCIFIFLFTTAIYFNSINFITKVNSSETIDPISKLRSASDLGDWDIIAEDIPIEWDDTTVDDNLRESIYSLVVGDWVWTNPYMSEEVLFDEIEVRRLVRNDILEYQDAILILPMMFTDANVIFHWEDYYTGEQLNNPEYMFVYPYLEAGFDVYCLSTRDHNVPVDFYYDSASWVEMMRWGAEEYLSDIHEAVELIKIVSGFDRIYLNTQEIGTALGMMYAVEHEENLKGIIAISGGTGGMLDKPPFLPSLSGVPIEDLDIAYEIIEGDPWLGTGSALFPFLHNYYHEAFTYPNSEDIINSPFGDISWFMMLGYFYYGDPAIWEFICLNIFGLPLEPGTLSAGTKVQAIELYILLLGVSLLIPGISLDAKDFLGLLSIFHPFYPWRVLIDIQHMSQVENSPYLERDWDEEFDVIDIPILTFVDTLAVNWWDQADYSADTLNPDNTVYIMEYQGVPDLFLGAQYRELIIYPSIEWMMERSDNTKPVINIISPKEGLITNQDVFLTYVVSDDVSAPDNIVITGPASGTSYTSEGYYHEIITATDEAGNTATASVSFIIDRTAPVIEIISPNDRLITNQEVIFSYFISDDVSASESITITGPASGTPYNTEGVHNIVIIATDEAGNTNTASVSFTIDKTKPITSIELDPPYFEINEIIHLTSTTPIIVIPEEIQGGSAIDETYYRIFNNTYNSGLMVYTDIFTLNQQDFPGLYDGEYDLEYYSTDIAGNIEDPPKSKSIVLDNSPPELIWLCEGCALQDCFLFDIIAEDATETTDLEMSIRELNGPIVAEISVINVGNNHWKAIQQFDTTTLPDGYYELEVFAIDKFGHSVTEVFSFSIRNWAIVVLLPSTEENKAGRTMPVKFSLRVAEAVDPTMPFVVNQELDIFITDLATSEVLQHSLFGESSKDYRINDITEHYITNFKTHKIPTTYSVSVYRKTFFIDSFEFETVK